MRYTTEYLAGLNKGDLRNLCRTHNIAYTALNTEGMRAALATVPAGDELPTTEPVEPVPEPTPELPASEALVVEGVQVATTVPRDLPPVQPAPAKAPKAPKVLQPEQNGVKRPKSGTICAQIWDWCDAQSADGVRPEAKVLRAALGSLDDTTKTVQFYRWRKFNGITGR